METCSNPSSRPHNQKLPLYLTHRFLLLLLVGILTLGPHGYGADGRPTPTKSEDGGDLDPFFDSQRHSSLKQQQILQNHNEDHDENGQNPNSQTMIVRVIVTSSSSSSSSTSSQENPDYADATFTDFEFPVNSSPTTPTTTTTPTPPPIKADNSSPSPEKKDVEDIFSAFYKAFSQNNNHHPLTDASHNVERFQVFYPESTSSGDGERDDGEGTSSTSPFSREFGQRSRGLLDGFGPGGKTTPKSQPNPHHHDDGLTVVKAVSSSSSSSSSYGRSRNRSPPPRQWTPLEVEKVVAVKSVSTSSSLDNSYQRRNPNPSFQYHPNPHNSQTTPPTTPPQPETTFRSTRRRQRARQRQQRYEVHNPDVQISISSSTSSDEFNPSPDSEPHPLPPSLPLPLRQEQHQLNNYQKPYQYTTPTTTTTTSATTTPKPPSYNPSWQPQIWSQPAQVWGEPAKVWGEPAKVWGEPAKVWGVPEQLWGHSTTSTTTTTTTPKPNTTRRPRYISRTTKYPKYSGQPPPRPPTLTSRDEDYPRDAEAVEQEEPGGSFVVLGDDDPETDSIDGSFDHHLGLPPLSPRPISLDQFKTFNFSYHHTFKHLNLSNLANRSSESSFSPRSSSSSSNNFNSSSLLPLSSSPEGGDTDPPSESSGESSGESPEKDEKMFGYVLEGSNVRRYRVEERTPDGYIVGEYGVLNNQNAFLRGVRYTADGTINPRLIHEALMNFLSLRR